MRIGIAKEYQLTSGMDPQVTAAVDAAMAKYKELGATFVDISLPHTEYGIAAYYVIARLRSLVQPRPLRTVSISGTARPSR